jgi:hypothetical protein
MEDICGHFDGATASQPRETDNLAWCNREGNILKGAWTSQTLHLEGMLRAGLTAGATQRLDIHPRRGCSHHGAYDR